MQYTGSISRGDTAEKHNTRECYRDEEHTPKNIDRARSAENVTLVNRSLDEVYRDRFGEALEAYNAQQVAKNHPERQIPDYLAKVREDKKLKPMYEFVVQVGNVDVHPDADTAQQIYQEWLDGFRSRFGEQFVVKQAIIHMDEAVPHMHVELVPCAQSKRGLAVQNSMNKAVKQAGFTDYKEMLADWDEVLTDVMDAHDIDRVAGDKEKQMGGVDIETYKRSMAVEMETEATKDRLECLQRRADAKANEIAGIDREIEKFTQDEVEPASESISESARTLFTARGDEEREEMLREELEGLRGRISEFERENQRAGERIGELEGGIRQLRNFIEPARDRNRRADMRFRAVAERVMNAMSMLQEVPNTLSRWALDIADKLGKRIYDPHSLEHISNRAKLAAKAIADRDGFDRGSRGIIR